MSLGGRAARRFVTAVVNLCALVDLENSGNLMYESCSAVVEPRS